jgi:hypothetical protein
LIEDLVDQAVYQRENKVNSRFSISSQFQALRLTLKGIERP